MTTVAGERRLRSLNPATGEVVADLPVTTPEQVRAAVALAREAAGPWGAGPWQRRRSR